MGSAKEEMMQAQEENRDRRLAEALGITYDELQQTDWEFDEITNNDDLVVDLRVKFGESSPKHILEKIDGLDEDNTVSIDPNALGSDHEDEDREG